MKSATEIFDEFRARISQAARDKEAGAPAVGGEEWPLDRGSLQGSAVDLAERDAVGVFPVGG